MTTEASGVMKIVKFDGTRASFPVWFSQFNALCAVKGVSEALKKDFNLKMPNKYDDVLDLNVAADKPLRSVSVIWRNFCHVQ